MLKTLFPVFKKSSAFIGKAAAADHDEIDKYAYAEKAACQKPENACSYLACIKPMYSECAEKKAQQKRCKS